MQAPTDLFTYQRRMMPVLLVWSVGSIAAGALGWWRGNAFWRGVGIQCVAWGAIDGIIALFGLRSAQRKGARYAAGDMSEEAYWDEARRFTRILWVNAGLDILYIAGGGTLARRSARANRRGMGAGIVGQGLFLSLFDTINALRIRVWQA